MNTRRQKIYPIWPLQVKYQSLDQNAPLLQVSKVWLLFSMAIFTLILFSSWETKKRLIVTGYTDYSQVEEVIRNKIPGTILDFEVIDQQYVKQGQLLYQLVCEKVDTKMQIQHNRIEYCKKQIEALSPYQLSKTNEPRQFDKIKRLEAQVQELSKSKQQLYLEKQQCQYLAPMDGIITWLTEVQEGRIVNAGKVMATLKGEDRLVSTFKVTNKQFSRLQLDKQVIIKSFRSKQSKEPKFGWIQHIKSIDQGTAYLISCSYPDDQSNDIIPGKTIAHFAVRRRLFPFLNSSAYQ